MIALLAALSSAAELAPGQWLVGEPPAPWFGMSVSVAGDLLVVGNSPGSPSEPLAWVFERRAGAWAQTGVLTGEGAPAAGAGALQVQVHASADLIALELQAHPDAVRVFARGPSGWARLPLRWEGGYVGAVDVDGDRVAVGSGGEVVVYTRRGGELVREGAAGLGGGAHVASLDLDGDRLLVGLPNLAAPRSGVGGGEVRALRRAEGGWEVERAWQVEPERSGHGHGVAWAGALAAASHPFGPSAPARDGGLLLWGAGERPVLDARGGADGLGGPVMASTGDSLAGAPGLVATGLHFDRDQPMHGGVSVLAEEAGAWVVAARRERELPHFGFAVALDGRTLAVGAPDMAERVPGRVWVTEVR